MKAPQLEKEYKNRLRTIRQSLLRRKHIMAQADRSLFLPPMLSSTLPGIGSGT